MSRLLNRFLMSAVGLAVAGSVVGCVPAEQYAGMKMKADQLSEQLAKSQGDTDRATARADLAERQLNAVNNNTASQTAMDANDREQISELQRRNDDVNHKLMDALALAGRAGPSQALPTTLNNELSDFAAKYPETIDFDPKYGVVKFKSDVVFGSGETALSPGAKKVLATFATILNSAGANSYDLLVAGNTDNTPVTNKATISHGNFDNWYLSAHRAIAVGHELIVDGVQPGRLGTVGYADQRPAATNNTADGKALNRRVEVLILPPSPKHGTSPVVFNRTRKPKLAAVSDAVPASAMMSKDGGSASPTTTPALSTMNK